MMRRNSIFAGRIPLVRVMILGAWLVAAALLPPGRQLQLSPAYAAPSAQTARTCANYQLLIRAQTSQGAAGHIAIIYRIHNLFGQACTLYGYPGVQLLDRRFLSLPTTVHRGAGNLIGGFSPRLVRLAPYGNAFFALGYSDVPVGNRPCQAMAFYLMIFAPNDFLPVVTYAGSGAGGIMSCTGDINVSPVTARPRYQ